jgi:diguanylate cyclase (GGDEF)-like protein/PAS domain S-box-containing protein
MEGVPQLLWRSHARGDWTWASPQWLAYTGQQPEESHGLGWLAAVHPDDHAATIEAWEAVGRQGELNIEFRVRHAAEGAWIWHRTRSLPVRGRDGHIAEWLGTTTDIHALKTLQQRQDVLLDEARRHALELEDEIRQRRLVEAELLYTAFHDDLTQLHNRAYFIQHLTLALERMRANPGFRCAVLFLDLDRFKLVNDSLGHKAGDLLLQEAALRLKGRVGEQGMLARLGGDEFAVLVENVGTMGDMVELASGIIDTMSRPFWLGRQEVFASCSIGLAQATSHHRLPEELLRDADIAMYHAKRHDTGGWSVFTDSMHESAVQALQLQTDLRHAVSRGEFVLHYQPICDSRSGAITGLEALVRWQHPQRGPVAPGEFIRVAEETGMIRTIGRWVLQEACGALRTWRERFPGMDLRLGVNVSGEELRDAAFVTEVCDTLAATGIPPSALELEVTESVFLDRPDRAGAILGSLRGVGVRVALDDFGTGYSSLSYLDQYPMDTIKIDRSFVARMATRPRSVAIVDTIVLLGRAMGLAIIAEGIEDARQLQLVRDVGCDAVQGYLLGRPMPACAVTQALERQSQAGPPPAAQLPSQPS